MNRFEYIRSIYSDISVTICFLVLLSLCERSLSTMAVYIRHPKIRIFPDDHE